MEDLFLFAPASTHIVDLATACRSVGRIDEGYDGTEFVVADPGLRRHPPDVGYAVVTEVDVDEFDFTPDVLGAARATLGGDVRAFSVSYWDIEFAKRVALAIIEGVPVVVDNDFGFVGTGDQFAAELRRRPEWEWRQREVT